MKKELIETIEIVKDYMPKDLVMGCYMKFSVQNILGDYSYIVVPFIEMLPEEDGWIKFSYIHPGNFISKKTYSFKGVKQSGIEILGTLDITAIEKYILTKDNYDYGYDHRSYTDYKIFYDKNGLGPDIRILNKDPKFYTEDQLTHLNKLLKQL